MNDNLIKQLIETFKAESEKYSSELEGVVNYNVEEFFRKNNPAKGYHSIDACISFETFTLKLEYKINISMLIPKSTIEMRFMFENGKLPVEYSIYDLLDIIDNDNFKCYTFGYVTSIDNMKLALEYLIETFKSYRNKIQELSENSEKIALLEKNITEKIDVLLDEKVFESKDAYYLMHMLELYYVVDVSRFTTDCYQYYIDGKYKKAIKAYKKLGKKITSYERRLVEYIENGNIEKPLDNTLNSLSEARSLKGAKKELIPMYLSWLILTPIWLVVYDLIYYIALYFLSKNALYIEGAVTPMLFMCAMITAIINSFFTRKITYKLLFRKTYDKFIALDEIENSSAIQRVMNKLFQFIIALGIVTSVLVANTNIAFYDNYFVDNQKILNLKGKAISYEEVKCVYKANARMNDFGQVVNNPAHVIVLKDGTKIDLYYNFNFEDTEKNMIPIFKQKNIEIKEIDFIENIQVD